MAALSGSGNPFFGLFSLYSHFTTYGKDEQNDQLTPLYCSKDEQNDQLTPLSDTKIAPIFRKGHFQTQK